MNGNMWKACVMLLSLLVKCLGSVFPKCVMIINIEIWIHKKIILNDPNQCSEDSGVSFQNYKRKRCLQHSCSKIQPQESMLSLQKTRQDKYSTLVAFLFEWLSILENTFAVLKVEKLIYERIFAPTSFIKSNPTISIIFNFIIIYPCLFSFFV